MKFTELWKIAGTVSDEITFNTFMEAYKGYGDMNQKTIDRVIKKAKSNKLVNKVLSAIFILLFVIVLTLPFEFIPTFRDIILVRAMSISIFFVISFTFIIMFGLLNSTTFISSKAVQSIKVLPLNKKELSAITLLSFIRLNDIQIIVMLFAYPIMFLFLTFSILGFILLLVFSFLNVIFALTVMLILAKFFYFRITGTSETKLKSIFRFIIVLIWGISVFGLYILINSIIYVIPYVLISLNTLPNEMIVLLFILYPFQIGYFVASVSTQTIQITMELGISIFFSIIYLVLGRYALKWLGNTINDIGQGTFIKTAQLKLISLKLSFTSPRRAIMIKDLRMATRKPQLAFMFAFPIIFLLMYILPMLSETRAILSSMLLLASNVYMAGMMFSLFSTYLLTIDGSASSYTKMLPLYIYDLLISKALFTTIIYSVLPIFTIIVVAYINFGYFPYFIGSIFTIGSVYASGCFANFIVLQKIKTGKYVTGTTAAQSILWIQVTIISVALLTATMGPYLLLIIIYGDLLLALSTSGIITFIEMMLATWVLKKYAKK